MQPRRRIKKRGRGLVVLWAAFLVVFVGGAVVYDKGFENCQQWVVRFFNRAAAEQKTLTTSQKNSRGIIYDRNFKEMAVSLDRVSVLAKPRELVDIHDQADALASALGMSEQDLLNLCDQEAQQVWLAKDVSVEEEKAVADLHLQGISFHREQVRFYPYKSVASQLIGFADHKMGLAGVERYYHRLLDQASITQDDFPNVDLGGRNRTGNSGHHLVLTLDLKIQDILEKLVAALGASQAGAEIAALLMETDTGAIIAGANFPSFDPNIFYRYKEEDLVNILLLPTPIPSKIRRFFRDAALLKALPAGDAGGQAALPWSLVAGPVDPAAADQQPQDFGIHEKLDLDFTAANDAREGDALAGASAIPEGEAKESPIRATPLQMLVAMNAVFRKDSTKEPRMVFPHILDRVLERDGRREYPFQRRLTKEPLAEQSSAPMLAESGRLLTAQGQKGVLDSVFIEDEYAEIRPVASDSVYSRTRIMLGAVPADSPELLLLVVVRRPFLEPSSLVAKKNEGKEWELRGPVVKILPTMVALQQVHKNIADMMSRSERLASNYQQTQGPIKETALATMLAEETLLMPDVVGLSMRKALRVLQDKKVKVRIQGTGRVVSQSPSAGMPLAKVQECRLSLKKDERAAAKGAASPGKGKKKTGAE